jgi:hypothetical protein
MSEPDWVVGSVGSSASTVIRHLASGVACPHGFDEPVTDHAVTTTTTTCLASSSSTARETEQPRLPQCRLV